jgi:hypothetical protein
MSGLGAEAIPVQKEHPHIQYWFNQYTVETTPGMITGSNIVENKTPGSTKTPGATEP